MIPVHGKVVDDETRCIHYKSEVDVIAIKFKCCGQYYPCFECHDESTHHKPEVWPRDSWNERAVLCGRCQYEMTIHEYLNSNNNCPECGGAFNPKCSNHYHLYFEME